MFLFPLVVQIYGRNLLFPNIEPSFLRYIANHHIFHSDGFFLYYLISYRVDKGNAVRTSGNALYVDYFHTIA